MKNIFLILGIGLAALIIVAVIIGSFYIGPIVKIGMEQVGPKVTQASIKVDAVDISLLSGSASVKGLKVGNPQGYSTSQAISVGTVAVSLSPFSVASDKIVVHSVHVESPEITYEGGVNGNNLSKILDNVNAFAKNAAPAPNNAPANAPAQANKPAPKIEVDDFLITGAKIHVNISGLGNKDITLPDIHLTDLGKDSNGLTPAELASTILKAISSETVNAVTSSLGNIGHGLQNLGKATGQTVGDNVSRVTSSLSGLLGK